MPTFTFTPRPTLTATQTFTPAPTRTPRPTLTLTPINAPTQTASTAVIAGGLGSPTPTLDTACNRAEFLGDVTIVDNATLRPGEAFRKTWRIQNVGGCPWTSAYQLVFVRGDAMGSPQSVPLPALVVAGQTADVSVDLLAPSTPGHYEGYWQLRTPEGPTFGIGPGGAGNLWVKIQVAGQPVPSATPSVVQVLATPTVMTAWAEATLTAFVATETAEAALTAPSSTPRILPTPATVVDFATDACTAQWQANDGILDCPGQEGDARGTISILNQVTLEDATTISGPALLAMPSASQDGYILGLYPQFAVQAGDRFRAKVGCQFNASECSVLFRLSYLDASGAAHDLWTLGEFYDGHYFDLDLDLIDLAGQQVRFVLSVNNLGSSAGDRALWVEPRIVRVPAAGPTAGPSPSAVPSATSTPAPTPTATIAAASPTPPVIETPAAPLPQFFESVLEFFRNLFGIP